MKRSLSAKASVRPAFIMKFNIEHPHIGQASMSTRCVISTASVPYVAAAFPTGCSARSVWREADERQSIERETTSGRWPGHSIRMAWQ